MRMPCRLALISVVFPRQCRRSIRSCCFNTCFSPLIEVQLVSHFHFELFQGPGLQRDQLLDQLPQPLLNPSIKPREILYIRYRTSRWTCAGDKTKHFKRAWNGLESFLDGNPCEEQLNHFQLISYRFLGVGPQISWGFSCAGGTPKSPKSQSQNKVRRYSLEQPFAFESTSWCPAELPRYKMPTKLRCTKTHSGRIVWYVSCRFPATITCNNYLLCWELQHYSACLWITPISVATISQVQMIGLTLLSNHQSFIAVSCHHHSGGPKPLIVF